VEDEKLVPAADEREIRAMVVRYADAISRSDAAALEDTWAEDCRFVLVGVNGLSRELNGRDTVVEYQRAHMGGYGWLLQVVGQGLIWPSGSGAEGRWMVWEIGRRDGAEKDRMGVVCYSDRYAREGGRWTFAERHLAVHYNAEEATSGEYAPLPPLPSSALRGR
jgi:hypothetical protein